MKTRLLYLRRVSLLFATVLISFLSNGQEQLISQFLSQKTDELKLTSEDVSNWVVTDNYHSKNSGVEHVYIRQTYNNIEIFNAVGNFNIINGEVISYGLNFESSAASKINTAIPSITPFDAIGRAADQLGITYVAESRLIEAQESNKFIMVNTDISIENIPVKLMYMPTNDHKDLRLVWDLSIYEHSQEHWWSVRIDAVSGELIHKLDWVVHCSFESCQHEGVLHTHDTEASAAPMPAPPPGTDQYNVFAIPVESPSHGPRTLVVGPSDATASPYGWHDINGALGNEYTITRGNNVHAYEDQGNNDAPGTSPNGGASINFDFALNLSQNPSGYVDAAVTNLFYMNNIMHDVWYQYGFDEVSGNFQENNYGNGGAASDYVYAEAQDGGGTNNANFATPGDGQNPRMQMYLWNGTSAPVTVQVNSPANIAGSYSAIEAAFGPGLTTDITADFALYEDNTPDINDGCEAAINAGSLNGKIVVIRRGTCNFTVKVANAESYGALAVIMVNNVAGAPIVMGGTDPGIGIPSVMVSNVDGEAIIAELQSGNVNGTLLASTGNWDRDGDFDNGIIAHEYGHGISTRLTGGPSNSNCLFGDEQMGEGWSDWFGLMLTIEPGDQSTDIRGIGTYAVFEPTNGGGIRPAPYSTDVAINNYTYSQVNAVSIPHGVGFVWCTMLWDMTWGLIDQYGFDPDVYNGTGGNNIAMNLVIEALKLQPCDPGFVDGRDAILQADQLLYGGANQCIIWEAFAARGCGFSADQGSSGTVGDETEAYDLPGACLAPTDPPVADFSSVVLSSCGGDVNFTDESTNYPDQWGWDFGDGNTSTVQNPSHTYTSSGTYTVTLEATNALGTDVITFDVTITLPPSPTASDVTGCSNQAFTLNGSATGDIIWYDASGTTPLDTTNTFTTPVLTNTTTYMAENVIFAPIQNVGPVDNTIGTSAYHGNAGTFVINFTVTSPFELLSVWIDAGSAGDRTITVWDNFNGNGAVYANPTVNVPTTGGQRIPLNIVFTEPGNYSIGGPFMDMRRNDGGVNYPYSLAGVVDLVSSNASGSELQYYYYYYDWEVQELPCRSAQVPVQAIVNPTATGTDQIQSCTSIVWIDGNTYSSNNNTATHTLTAANGCDSIVTLDLTIIPADFSTQNVTACGDYVWSADGNTYNTAGTYTAVLQNQSGCDSTVTLNLTMNTFSATESFASACGSYTWALTGNTYVVSGDYDTTMIASNGCDSIVTLHLTINSPNTGSESVTSCSSYTWPSNSQTYTSSGNYTTVLTNAAGCDSVVTLNLTINQPTAGTETISSCESYTWSTNGQTYTSSGSYTATLTGVNGCDSIATLDLTINTPYTSAEDVTSCTAYTWPADGQTYSNSGSYSTTLIAANGCDSVVTLNLTIPVVNANVDYITSVQLQVTTTGASAYQWIDCSTNSEIAGATNQTYTATVNGDYAAIVTVSGCVDTSACITVDGVGIVENDFGSALVISPNPTSGDLTIEFGETYTAISLRIHAANGQLIDVLDFNNTSSIDYTIQEAKGVYMFEIDADGKKALLRVLKQD